MQLNMTVSKKTYNVKPDFPTTLLERLGRNNDGPGGVLVFVCCDVFCCFCGLFLVVVVTAVAAFFS